MFTFFKWPQKVVILVFITYSVLPNRKSAAVSEL